MGTTLILVYFEGSFKSIDLMISVFYRKLYIETLPFGLSRPYIAVNATGLHSNKKILIR